jgi:hypothetical protein
MLIFRLWVYFWTFMALSPALGQQMRFTPKAVPDSPLVHSSPDAAGPGTALFNRPPPEPEVKPYTGSLTDDEKAMIVRALERMKMELKWDPKSVDNAMEAEIRLVQDSKAVSDLKLFPTIGFALSLASNVEVDKIDENGVTIIDREASRKASQPYCDLHKKLNPQAGCTVW